MRIHYNPLLLTATVFSAIAALLHIGCIVFGASWYRFLGADEGLVQLAEAGHWYPTVVASVIAAVLFVWSAYALSGAGVIRRLPMLRLGLCTIATLYIARGAGFAVLMQYFPGNSLRFWLLSSGICLALGLTYLAGVRQVWARL